MDPLRSLVLGVTAGKSITSGALTLGLAIAGITGGAAGALASHASSPGKRDVKNMQRSLLRDKLKWETEMAKRRGDLEGSGDNKGRGMRMGI